MKKLVSLDQVEIIKRFAETLSAEMLSINDLNSFEDFITNKVPKMIIPDGVRLWSGVKFSANDLDSGESFEDLCQVDVLTISEETVESKVNRYLDTSHPITTISGNTWECDGWNWVGRLHVTYFYKDEKGQGFKGLIKIKDLGITLTDEYPKVTF